ncbi:mediterrocin family bacteriocin [Gracilibacillus boraciitolerans]|nr:hypothetical protein [Gracilibacillus boraciitolerans]
MKKGNNKTPNLLTFFKKLKTVFTISGNKDRIAVEGGEMMKKFKILVLSFFTIAFLVGGGVSSVSAAEYNYSSSGKSFSKAWSSTPINTSTRTMKYGYNTSWINEDYTHTYHKNSTHTAYVKNTSKAQEKNARAGSYAKVEITHASGTVYYSYEY